MLHCVGAPLAECQEQLGSAIVVDREGPQDGRIRAKVLISTCLVANRRSVGIAPGPRRFVEP